MKSCEASIPAKSYVKNQIQVSLHLNLQTYQLQLPLWVQGRRKMFAQHIKYKEAVEVLDMMSIIPIIFQIWLLH